MNDANLLKQFLNDLKKLKKDIQNETTDRINKMSLRTRAEGIASNWFSDTQNKLQHCDVISAETLEKYADCFSRLIKLSSGPSNRKTSYVSTISEIIKSFQQDLITPVITNPISKETNSFSNFFLEFSDIPEMDYLQEAIGCAENKYYRAATVLGWSAAVYRFHSTIEKIGFDKFNSAVNTMAGMTTGRFKKFTNKTLVNDRNELNEVFDSYLLWVLEGMNLIDLNQHTRLKGCFDFRCQAAHPCEAPITDYNLLSFFSDIKEIVFKNPKFQL